MTVIKGTGKFSREKKSIYGVDVFCSYFKGLFLWLWQYLKVFLGLA
jgi:hypothetical protein